MNLRGLIVTKASLESRIEDIEEEIADLEHERFQVEDELDDINDSIKSYTDTPPCTPEESDGCFMCPPEFRDKDVIWVHGEGWLCLLCAWQLLLGIYREAA